MIEHYMDTHGVILEEELLEFEDQDRFMSWKEGTEQLEVCQFTCRSGPHDRREYVIRYYRLYNPLHWMHRKKFWPPIVRVSDKVMIPQEEHPDINFVGLLIGPRGNTLKFTAATSSMPPQTPPPWTQMPPPMWGQPMAPPPSVATTSAPPPPSGPPPPPTTMPPPGPSPVTGSPAPMPPWTQMPPPMYWPMAPPYMSAPPIPPPGMPNAALPPPPPPPDTNPLMTAPPPPPPPSSTV
ncbi:unnamed protein product [Nesidiocoris tenuis]|uniref:Branchpoint-bridging protein n=1 Tax=Nesidiocoris tenuis TaxID=355587 RepID=A0A6H5HIA7_9HEMI|nr:unnamed protein product [Nesidiocoris tenuis]